jgi:FtsH-binding integral membrane protein
MTISSRNQQIAAHPGVGSADSTAVTRDQARAVFGQVMGFVALTLGFLALGAYIGRDLSGGWGILAFVASFGCIIGLNVASTRGNEQLAISLLFGLGLLLGLARFRPELVCRGRSRGRLAGRGRHRRVRRRARRGRVRDSP